MRVLCLLSRALSLSDRACVRVRVLCFAEAEALREKHRNAQSEVTTVEEQIRSLEEKSSKDFGPGMRFERLSRECISFEPGGEFSYELCPYNNARQQDKNGGSTEIGRWEGFAEGHAEMRFNNGQHCWNAGARTLKVFLSCAGANKILGVEEPEVCKYTMRLETPAACTEELVQAAQADVDQFSEQTHDEL